MVDAMRIVKCKEPRASCIIVGPVDRTWLPKDFLLKEEDLLRQGGIELVGEVPYEKVPKSLSKAAIAWLPWLVTPNNSKGTPIKLFEYMSAGLPIVASEMGFIKKIIEESKCGLLAEPENPEAHAKGILYLFEHPEEAREMGKTGRRAIEEKYDWETEGEKLLALYEGLLG